MKGLILFVRQEGGSARGIQTGISKSVSLYHTGSDRLSFYRDRFRRDVRGKGVFLSVGCVDEPSGLRGIGPVSGGEFLRPGVSLLQVVFLTLMVNIRHIFYGISLLEKFHSMGPKRWYMIFGLTDETYSLLCTTRVPEGVEEDKFLFAISIMNQSYWVVGSAIGGLAGAMLPINSEGIDFAMTALFVVIFVEQWMDQKNRMPEMIGVAAAFLCLQIFGADGFVLPSMILIVLVLFVARTRLERQVTKECR